MITNNNHKAPDYLELQSAVDDMIEKFGFKETVRIIKDFCRNPKDFHKIARQNELTRKHIIAETIAEFDLDEKQFLISEAMEYREARKVCYHLFHKYIGDRHSTIAKAFGKKRGSAQYFIGKCNEILSFPKSRQDFVERYREVEISAIHYMGGLRPYTSRYIESIKTGAEDQKHE